MTTELLARLREAANALVARGAHEVYVFGSAANGTLRPDSDIDLAVSGLPPALFYRAAGDAMDAMGRPVDLVDLDDSAPIIRYLKAHGNLVRVS
jgi:predicted nucleotidyltransferase